MKGKPWSCLASLMVAATLGLGLPNDAAGTRSEPGQPSTGSLIAIADMQVARSAHSATALADGRVLVAGGFIVKGSSVGAQAYQPATRRFVALPPMITTRHSHTATLLPDGKVLIAGGYGEGAVTLGSAELFDPRTNAFAPTGAMKTPRADHVAIPLIGGKVLIAGGLGSGWNYLASAEIYDPATGRFSPTGEMTMPRESHRGVLLPDGRVVVVGGHNGQRKNLTILASAELYNPASGRFSRAGAMRMPRHKHDAVLLPEGRVLITGGADHRDDRGVYSSSELFDPKTGSFIAGPEMKLGRYKHGGSSLVLPNGKVLVSGGAPQAEIYDPTSRVFRLVPGKPRMAGQFSAAAPISGGEVLITGGYGNGTGPRASAWLYRP
ncbi:kelch repeat-containing protein [Thermomonas sp. HDW16]|uniref:Kelch repeat-containing protein n=1 Tax=Thermomonas sp. HDW16 TaxID=2714945 RepID=UPI00140AA666|nr:kelch repeat-containing protein [Thermomonas sp. HDW16]QIL19864.1 hypothetical protein G7079_03455 [Thermomonas sp. HDW16]